MKASQLRDLSRKYAAGGIGREKYQAERRRMIAAITAGEMDLKYRELDPESSNGSPAIKPSRTVMAAAALLVVLLVAFAVHYLADNSGPEQAPVETAAAPSNPAITLLQDFNDADDWSDEALSAIETEWQALPAQAREDARDSVAYRRISREVQTRIREHEALVSAGGSPDALMRAARLRTFAERLGVSM